jgi:hypothetical protein
MSALIITYAKTENLFNGEPWPPDGSDFWAVVTRSRKHTIWRRITAVADQKRIDRRDGAHHLAAQQVDGKGRSNVKSSRSEKPSD